MTPTPVAAAVERKRRRDSPRNVPRGILSVMQTSFGEAQMAPTDLERFYDAAITGVEEFTGTMPPQAGLRRAGGAELGAGTGEVLWQAREQGAAVSDRVVKLLEGDVEGGQRAFLDCAM